MEQRRYEEGENGNGMRRSSQSPIAGSGRSFRLVLLLSGVDPREDLLVGRKPERLLIRVGDLVVDRYLEDAGGALFERRRDAELGLDGGLQTGGLWEVVSLPAVSDLDVHPLLLALYSNTMRADRGGIP